MLRICPEATPRRCRSIFIDVPNLKGKLRRIVVLKEFQEVKSLVLKSMENYWREQGFGRCMAQAIEQSIEVGVERARADERALLCRLARRKFGWQAGERLSDQIDGVTDPKRLAEVGDWIIDCLTEAELLARAKHASIASPEPAN